MEDDLLRMSPLDAEPSIDSGVPVMDAILPTAGEDTYPEIFIASIDPSDPVLSGTRSSSYNSAHEAI